MTTDRSIWADDWHGFLEDAAHYPGGHAAALARPRTIEDVVDIVRAAKSILPIGAQSSLTGGATPMGEVLLSMSGMTRILSASRTHITVQAGVTVAAMQEHLARLDAWFPPAPTYTGATAGGIVATNAAGAATFKYGSTRDWVDAITIVLADGTVLRLERGERIAAGRTLAFHAGARRIVLEVPGYTMPRVDKRSAGYHAAPGMDLIDLFIGSEGTLGVVVEITFRVLSPAPHVAWALVPCPGEPIALALVAALRDAAASTWRTRDPNGMDVAAIEHIDRRSIEILREDGADRKHNVSFPEGTELALLIQLELPGGITSAAAFDQIAGARSPDAPDSPLVRFCRLLDRTGVLDDAEIVFPGNPRRASDLVAIREAVPAGVNQRVGRARREIDPRIEKTAADMIVPFARFGEMLEVYRAGFTSRGLDYAVWGHVSDGNVHPNVLPRSYEDVLKGRDAILEFGREVARMGGCPLAEHGVGRNPVKQALLRQLYGDAGIEAMQAVKQTLDPEWKLAPGVIFPRKSRE